MVVFEFVFICVVGGLSGVPIGVCWTAGSAQLGLNQAEIVGWAVSLSGWS